jgi:hypothetical protein
MLQNMLRNRLDQVDGILVDLEEMRGQRVDELASFGYVDSWVDLRYDGPFKMYADLIDLATERQRVLEHDITLLEEFGADEGFKGMGTFTNLPMFFGGE